MKWSAGGWETAISVHRTLQEASSERICETESSLSAPRDAPWSWIPHPRPRGEAFCLFRARGLWSSVSPLPLLQTQECVTGRQCHQEQGRNADREACLPQVSILLRRLSLPRFPLQENGTSGLLCYCLSHFYFPIPLYCSNTLEHVGSASQGSQNKKTLCQPWRQGGRAELGVPDAHPLEQRPQRVRVNCPHNQLPPGPALPRGRAGPPSQSRSATHSSDTSARSSALSSSPSRMTNLRATCRRKRSIKTPTTTSSRMPPHHPCGRQGVAQTICKDVGPRNEADGMGSQPRRPEEQLRFRGLKTHDAQF